MTTATVLMPTHNHGETLRHSIPTALRQTVEDIELFVIGDGVPDITRKIVRDFASRDSRIRFFDFPKAPSRGERYRHQVLQQASGEIVCYLFDDDLWLPNHVAVMREALRHADFAVTTFVTVRTSGELVARFVDLERPLHRLLFTTTDSGGPSVPTCAAHTMALYRRLPHGWRTTPPGLAPDKYMWEQCLSDPATVARGVATPTALIFPDPPRRHWTTERRIAELEHWSDGLQNESFRDQFVRDVTAAEEAGRWRYRMRLRLSSWTLSMPRLRKLLRTIWRLAKRSRGGANVW